MGMLVTKLEEWNVVYLSALWEGSHGGTLDAGARHQISASLVTMTQPYLQDHQTK